MALKFAPRLTDLMISLASSSVLFIGRFGPGNKIISLSLTCDFLSSFFMRKNAFSTMESSSLNLLSNLYLINSPQTISLTILQHYLHQCPYRVSYLNRFSHCQQSFHPQDFWRPAASFRDVWIDCLSCIKFYNFVDQTLGCVLSNLPTISFRIV